MLNLKPYLSSLFDHGYVEISTDIDYPTSCLVNSIRNVAKTIMTYDKSIADGYSEVICFKPNGNLDTMELDWHQDNSYFKNKTFGALLFNYSSGDEVLPTYFVDSNKVIQDLDLDFKNRLREASATWNFTTHLNTLTLEQKKASYSERYLKLMERGLLSNSSNILINHPVSNIEVLWLSPATISKTDLSKDEIEYLKELFDKHSFPLHWRPKQLIMYDNLRMLHRRSALDPVKHKDRELRAIRFNYFDVVPNLDNNHLINNVSNV